METLSRARTKMERRLDSRTEIAARVECRVGARSEPAISYDLSSDGCLLQCPLGFVEPGDDIGMRFPHVFSSRDRSFGARG